MTLPLLKDISSSTEYKNNLVSVGMHSTNANNDESYLDGNIVLVEINHVSSLHTDSLNMLDMANQDSIPENNRGSHMKASLGSEIHQNISTSTKTKYNLVLVDKNSTLENNDKSYLDGSIVFEAINHNASPYTDPLNMRDVANQHSLPENNGYSHVKAGLDTIIYQNVSTPTEAKYNLALVVKYSSPGNNKSYMDGSIIFANVNHISSLHTVSLNMLVMTNQYSIPKNNGDTHMKAGLGTDIH